MLTVNVCLSDIPADRFKVVNTKKGPKTFLNLIVVEKQTPDAYGNTHYVAASKTEEERKADPTPLYCGDGKEFKKDGGTPLKTNPWASGQSGTAANQPAPAPGQTSFSSNSNPADWSKDNTVANQTQNGSQNAPDDLPF